MTSRNILNAPKLEKYDVTRDFHPHLGGAKKQPFTLIHRPQCSPPLSEIQVLPAPEPHTLLVGIRGERCQYCVVNRLVD